MIKDCKDPNGLWYKSRMIEGVQHATKSYEVWNKMRQRCKVGGLDQLREPTYIGCTISKEFQDFQFFASWCQEQVGYGLDGYEIDKDLLIACNKEYGKERCVFIPGALNRFLNKHEATQGLYPQGVTAYRDGIRYMAYTNFFGKRIHLGLFDTPEAAFAAYKIAKVSAAKLWAKKLQDGFIVDQRVIERLLVWTM